MVIRARISKPLASLVALAISTEFICGCATTVPAQFTENLFQPYEVTTGIVGHPTILTGSFLSNDAMDLAVVGIGENDEHRVQVYEFDGVDWVLALEAALQPDVLFVDVANIGGIDRLITTQDEQLNWFEPDSEIEHLLVEIPTNYNAAPSGLHYAGAELLGPSHASKIPHVDITRDLNHDGRDDLVMPDHDGFWTSIQLEDGTFTKPVKLGPREPFLSETAFDETRSYGDVGITALTIPWYLSRIHQLDYNQDGRSDLAFWNEDHFDVYCQGKDGLFAPQAEAFTTDVHFDADGTYSLLFGFSEMSAVSLLLGLGEYNKQQLLHCFRDINGDGLADLVTHTLEGRSPLSQTSQYVVYFGKPASHGISFTPSDSAVIHPQGTAGAGQLSGYSSVQLQDLDGNGQIDMIFKDVNITFADIIAALLLRSVSIDLEFYRMEHGAYSETPDASHRIRPSVDQGAFFPAVLVGDVNGDQHSDLMVGMSRNELFVFLGVDGPDLFMQQPLGVTVSMPDDERNTWLVDLNSDSKQDILMHHPSATVPHRMTILIAK